MILVTGADGWIASRLVAHLSDRARPHTADVRDHDALAQAARGCTAIVHLAFKNLDHDGTGFQANIDGTRTVAEVAADADVPLISLSTCGVYGHAPHRDADEHTPLAPDTPLSRSRAAADRDLLARHAAGQPVCIVRHRFVIGPGDTAVLPRLHRVVARSPVWLDGGRARLSLIHVDDLAATLARAADSLPTEPVLHATDGREHSLRALGIALCDAWGGTPPRASVPLWTLLGPVRAWERILGVDPELSASALSSIRLRLVATDQSFSNARLRAWWPEVSFKTLEEGIAGYDPGR